MQGFVEFLGSEQSSTPWPHFELKYSIETLFQSWISSQNQITTYPSLVSRRKSSFEGLNFEEITPFRSLEDEYGIISSRLSFVRTSVETASHRYHMESRSQDIGQLLRNQSN